MCRRTGGHRHDLPCATAPRHTAGLVARALFRGPAAQQSPASSSEGSRAAIRSAPMRWRWLLALSCCLRPPSAPANGRRCPRCQQRGSHSSGWSPAPQSRLFCSSGYSHTGPRLRPRIQLCSCRSLPCPRARGSRVRQLAASSSLALRSCWEACTSAPSRRRAAGRSRYWQPFDQRNDPRIRQFQSGFSFSSAERCGAMTFQGQSVAALACRPESRAVADPVDQRSARSVGAASRAVNPAGGERNAYV